MAEFLYGSRITSELENIIDRAKQQLIIISPFIKLHPGIVDRLKSKKENDKLKITVVFGKNEDNISKSFIKDDFEFLKNFPNIEIKYEPRLHAKYYANESMGLLSSMNLHAYSQNNNIEFGILTKATIVGNLSNDLLGDSIDRKAFNYFEQEVIKNSKTFFQRTPCYEKTNLGLSKKYTHSNEIDYLSKKLGIKTSTFKNNKCKHKAQDTKAGYCIRTGEKIPFNPNRPLSDEAYLTWSKYRDKEYEEQYCHYSGEPSYGETSFLKPIMKKNWNKAKKLITS
jgi:hypothetical protein